MGGGGEGVQLGFQVLFGFGLRAVKGRRFINHRARSLRHPKALLWVLLDFRGYLSFGA